MNTAPTVPERIGPYLVERALGQGAMGALYLARDERSGRALAVKTLLLGQPDEAVAELRRRFSREAAAARRLQHPGIVAILDSGEEPGLAWLAMEHLPGHDLTRHVAESTRLAVEEVIAIGAQMADALGYAHKQGVLHRDIKPANAVFDAATGRVRITDFGVARVADALRTQTGVVLGTPAYMAPEQLAGLPLDGRADLFSLGVLLFQLLCARLPHEAATLGGLLNQIATRPAPDIRTLRPELPEPLAILVAQLLAKRPAQRPADGHALAEALRMSAAGVKFSRIDPRHNAGD